MEGGLINPLALIRTGAAKGVTSHQFVSLRKGNNDFLIVQDVIKFQFSIFPVL